MEFLSSFIMFLYPLNIVIKSQKKVLIEVLTKQPLAHVIKLLMHPPLILLTDVLTDAVFFVCILLHY